MIAPTPLYLRCCLDTRSPPLEYSESELAIKLLMLHFYDSKWRGGGEARGVPAAIASSVYDKNLCDALAPFAMTKRRVVFLSFVPASPIKPSSRKFLKKCWYVLSFIML